ncbi:MAG: DNA translocase FtsK 4TM domain-containing protein, partial [Acidobacteria bacterium]|nr:DNA translocase FtsK 4TM domain-containing protein [Acidobacteriota bacterium]
PRNPPPAGSVRPLNLFGPFGAHLSDWCLQSFGLGAFAFPVLLVALAWKWLRSHAVEAPLVRIFGSAILLVGTCAGLDLALSWRPFNGSVPVGGVLGILAGDYLVERFNSTGALLVVGTSLLLSLYLISTFSMVKLASWLSGPRSWLETRLAGFRAWRQARKLRKLEREKARQASRQVKSAERRTKRAVKDATQELPASLAASTRAPLPGPVGPDIVDDEPPFEIVRTDIPIRTLEDELAAQPPRPAPAPAPRIVPAAPDAVLEMHPPEPRNPPPAGSGEPHPWEIPSTSLLNEPPARNGYDELELKEVAARIKAKFEEFNVFGNVVQINPGPVVTTFEFKPEAGIKYSRIITLREDLCLGLHAESILIERIPGKPTVGIQVPNTKRELISLRQVLESEEFESSASRLTMSMGKDISGRIKVASLESMPHLLIAGSTGSGKSVMLNAMIMSVLYKATPDEVRLIMVDPKRVELGIYEGIPHLLTPVITEPKKATNALRNAVLEMERRLKLLASQGARNIEQYNKKMQLLRDQPRSLFPNPETGEQEDLRPLPYILILIDELADLMMLERAAVEETVTRLAQMARAVGMHLVLATQRPSVDVITGLIKANFPARISFRVATRVDSRTILDVMGSEHLLGKGDMLFLPPGSSRLIRVHGAYVTEAETVRVVDFWKNQARPDYDQTYLLAPPDEPADSEDGEEFAGEQDPMYDEALRVVLEMGKASTSTLQRRLRLGYGRAARILDMMYREGIIGPPDGSRPREVLKRGDWLHEVDEQLR